MKGEAMLLPDILGFLKTGGLHSLNKSLLPEMAKTLNYEHPPLQAISTILSIIESSASKSASNTCCESGSVAIS